MTHEELPMQQELLRVPVGSQRYGLFTEDSDKDIFILIRDVNLQKYNSCNNTAYFVWDIQMLQSQWGHPVLLGDLTGNCTGNKRLCAFLRQHYGELTYSAPLRTVKFGMEYIAHAERGGYISPIKAGLRTAMILSHMAAQAEDPFLLSEEEKAVLTRARTGGVPVEERVAIYRRTICPENIDRLMRMPDHPTIKTDLFKLIEEVITSC